jgi:cytochrome b561
MGDVHGILAWVLFALIGLHVVAALFHRFVLKDHVLQRMLPHAGPSRDQVRDR